MIPGTEYVKASELIMGWCNTHNRRATYYFINNNSKPATADLCCDPKLGGIMLPCMCVDLTEIAEIVEKPSKEAL